MVFRLARLSGFLTAVAVLLLALGGCQQHSSSSGASDSAAMHSGNVEQEVAALLDQYRQALLKKDAATLDRIWADDLTFINIRGDLLGKQNRMDNIKSGATAFKSIQVADQRIRVYGQTAVATSQVTVEAQYSGQEGSGNHRVTTVWARPKGAWQLVAVHMTRIGQ